MTKQWILVANSSIARFFGRHSNNESLVVLETLHRPKSRLPHSDSKRVALHPFAQAIADRLDEGRLSGQYDTLWLFVSSPLLGELKPALSRATDRRVEVAQDIDFTALDVDEIEARLQGIWQPSS